MMTVFAGTLTALITPFRDGEVDQAALAEHVARQIDAGVDGLIAASTTGEAATLTQREHDAVVEGVVALAGERVPVIAGVISNSTAEAVRQAQHAAGCGAAGVLVITPYYNMPTQEGLFRHLSAVAAKVDLPMSLYNLPQRCGVELSVATIRRLWEMHPNIVAIKHGTGRCEDVPEIMQVTRIAVLSGSDLLTLPLMSMGAVGAVSALANLAPRAVVRLTQALHAGDLSAARDANGAMYPLARPLFALADNPLPIKTALALRGWCAEEFRLPLCPLAAEQRQRLEHLLLEFPLE
ncbi:MAG: 4-hydroxy-tetrahydrodipicolinate synthase [Planctomycetes bacterium]|nr:4-hydroxy-tetrahydrodipicolinate synthase [Planctomycetota bacterium]